MTMNTHTLAAIAAVLMSAGLSSCVLDPDPVPEMPYLPRTDASPREEPVQTTTWETAPQATNFITPAPVTPAPAAPAPAAPKAPATPTPTKATKASLPDLPEQKEKPAPVVQPIKPLEISPLTEPTPAAPAAPAAPATPTAPAAAPSGTGSLKDITNDGPIPTAMRVEGDPIRVWNPVDPSKKLRIVNPKTNQPYPSGKKLKVPGTNFQFYVP